MLQRTHKRTGLILAITALLAAFTLNWFNNYSTAELALKTQKNLRAKEQQALKGLAMLDTLVRPNGNSFSEFKGAARRFFNAPNISFFVYADDTLNFWSSNLVPMDASINSLTKPNGMLHLRNGWYEYFLEEKGKHKKLALIFIKPEYDVQNSYFNNGFSNWMGLPPETGLRDSVNDLTAAVRSIHDTPLFEIFMNERTIKSERMALWPVILFFVSVILLLFFLLRKSTLVSLSVKNFALITIGIIALRALMIYFKWPGLLYNASLFTPGVYGNSQSFFNEFLGDIILNVLLFSAWAFVFYRSVPLKIKAGAVNYLALAIFLAVLIVLALQLNVTVKNLVFNSTIPFEFSNFFNLNGLSFLCLSVVFLNGFSIALLIGKFAGLFLNKQYDRTWYVFLFCLCAYGLSFVFFKNSFNAVEWFWLPALMVFTAALKNFNITQGIFSSGSRILLFAIITSWLFSTHNSEKEKQNMQVLADNLSDRQDAVLEGEFSDVAKKIKKDLRFKKALYRLPLFGQETEQQLRQNYFTGYFEKYNIQLAVFDSVCMPYFRNSELIFNNNEYFDDQVSTGIPTISDNLFFIEEHKGNTRYVGKIEFDKKEQGKAPYILYVQLEPKQFADAGSFPDLLLDEGLQKQNKYKQISYAVYKSNKLASFYGAYDYPLYNKDSTDLKKAKTGFKHHFVTPDKETRIVLSSKTRDFNYFFTTNSYYFLFYSLLGMALFLISSRINRQKIAFISLDRRIQVFTISILFFALLAVGIFTVKLVISKSEKDNVDQLTEKATQIHNELNPVLFNSGSLEINGKPYAESVLKKYTGLFNSDISLYNANGILFASSRPQLFDAGLSSKLINPLAIINLSQNHSSNFSTRDKIGSLNYLSLYTPLYNTSGDFIGYMNLPYFARQNDLEEGLSDYITTLLNVYVVLFLVSLFTGLIVTTYVTKPLRIVQQQLARISLGKKNEPIEWESNDEIGRLVNEYNQMLLKLEESAVLLAKSEREGAWQEMAKQVAHEIKNPLTPMKLNLQYLQKIINEGGMDFAEKFKSVSSSIIEQIDTLAHIANEFSNFAKMPKQNLENVNLNEVIQSTIELFKSNSITITFDPGSESALIVLADKNQCLRVFNNLIKNAVQAIPENQQGVIEIVANPEQEFVLISIKDNGSGIPVEMNEKIFTPNFTTKSTGTGLGLAMVKNIITSLGGKIWFESNSIKGTTFYLTFQRRSH